MHVIIFIRVVLIAITVIHSRIVNAPWNTSDYLDSINVITRWIQTTETNQIPIIIYYGHVVKMRTKAPSQKINIYLAYTNEIDFVLWWKCN